MDNIYLAEQIAIKICEVIDNELDLNGYIYVKPVYTSTATIREVNLFVKLDKFEITLKILCSNFDYVLIFIKYGPDDQTFDSFSGNFSNPDSIESIKNLVTQYIAGFECERLEDD